MSLGELSSGVHNMLSNWSPAKSCKRGSTKLEQKEACIPVAKLLANIPRRRRLPDAFNPQWRKELKRFFAHTQWYFIWTHTRHTRLYTWKYLCTCSAQQHSSGWNFSIYSQMRSYCSLRADDEYIK